MTFKIMYAPAIVVPARTREPSGVKGGGKRGDLKLQEFRLKRRRVGGGKNIVMGPRRWSYRSNTARRSFFSRLACFQAEERPLDLELDSDMLGRTFVSNPKTPRTSMGNMTTSKLAHTSSIWFDEFSEDTVDTYLRFTLEPSTTSNMGFSQRMKSFLRFDETLMNQQGKRSDSDYESDLNSGSSSRSGK